MKKNLFLGMTLGMALLANTAFAHLSGGYLSDIIDEHQRWPLATQCIATDVNLRTAARARHSAFARHNALLRMLT